MSAFIASAQIKWSVFREHNLMLYPKRTCFVFWFAFDRSLSLGFQITVYNCCRYLPGDNRRRENDLLHYSLAMREIVRIAYRFVSGYIWTQIYHSFVRYKAYTPRRERHKCRLVTDDKHPVGCLEPSHLETWYIRNVLNPYDIIKMHHSNMFIPILYFGVCIYTCFAISCLVLYMCVL